MLQPLELWNKFAKIPGGRFLFSKIIGRMVPYTGTLNATVLDFREGFARVKIMDRHQLRNHLKSVHAVALMNVAEFASGLALTSSCPPKTRAILKGFSVEFIKKARGTLIAESQNPKILSNEKKEYFVEVAIKDEAGDVVCKAKAHWLVGPEGKAS